MEQTIIENAEGGLTVGVDLNIFSICLIILVVFFAYEKADALWHRRQNGKYRNRGTDADKNGDTHNDREEKALKEIFTESQKQTEALNKTYREVHYMNKNLRELQDAQRDTEKAVIANKGSMDSLVGKFETFLLMERSG